MSDLMIGVIALVVAIVVFVVGIVWKRNHPKDTAVRVKKAKAMGHVVKAYKTKEVPRRRMRMEDPTEAYYRYEVNGKEYRYSFYERANAPEMITLYYLNNPRDAFWGYSKTIGQRFSWFFASIAPLIAFVIVVVLLKAL